MRLTAEPGYQVRTMTADELRFAVELAAREGWNPGLVDADAFYAADPAGFFVGLLDGRPVGCISAVSYAGVFGFVGLYIVLPEHRGKGYGLKLWQHAMRYLEGHNIGLDGVVEQQENYRKSGFALAHRNIRYAGVASGSHDSPGGLFPLAEIPFGDLTAYDRELFPASREAFLRAWVNLPGSVAQAATEERGLCGYGVMRPCREGFKIGPLFADTPEIAQRLYTGLTSRVAEGTRVYLDVPATNPAAVALAQRHAMTPVFETARMYTGDAPQLAHDRIFGITTFELG